MGDEAAPPSLRRRRRIKKYNEGTARKENAESENIGKQPHKQLYPPEIKKGRDQRNNIGLQQVRQKSHTGVSEKELSIQRFKQITPPQKLRKGKSKSPGPQHSRGVRLENLSIWENNRGEGKIQPQSKKREYGNRKSLLIKEELIGKRKKLYCLKKKATTNIRKNSGAKRCIRKKDIPTDFETRSSFLAVLGIIALATVEVTAPRISISAGEVWAWGFSLMSILFLLGKEANSRRMAALATVGSFRTTRVPNHILASTSRGRMESNRGGSSVLGLGQPGPADGRGKEEMEDPSRWKNRRRCGQCSELRGLRINSEVKSN
uniref:Uncharacterized protein n=1 Tax=Meloidogyne enterolobii TaxID=390850 RepID=A0A6V7V2R5_MELEN|nr:unnamed protein product [Meloidogyne enterolobii]